MDAFHIEASIYAKEYWKPVVSDPVQFPRNIAAPADQPEPENFADYPVSVTSERASKEWDATLQTPRDVLINKLREIDSGKIDPYCVVVFFGERTEGGVLTGFEVGGGDSHTALGIATRGLHKILAAQDQT